MLFSLLVLSFMMMTISMFMALTLARTEGKSMLGKIWNGLSFMSVVMVLGVAFLMIKFPEPMVEIRTDEKAVPAETQKPPATGNTAAGGGSLKSSSTTETGSLEPSLEYLIAVLEALKKGQPVPDEFKQKIESE